MDNEIHFSGDSVPRAWLIPATRDLLLAFFLCRIKSGHQSLLLYFRDYCQIPIATSQAILAIPENFGYQNLRLEKIAIPARKLLHSFHSGVRMRAVQGLGTWLACWFTSRVRLLYGRVAYYFKPAFYRIFGAIRIHRWLCLPISSLPRSVPK